MKQGYQGAWPRVKVAFGFSIKASARWRALWERPAPRQGYPVWHPPRSVLLSCGRGSLRPRGLHSRSLCLHGAGLKC